MINNREKNKPSLTKYNLGVPHKSLYIALSAAMLLTACETTSSLTGGFMGSSDRSGNSVSGGRYVPVLNRKAKHSPAASDKQATMNVAAPADAPVASKSDSLNNPYDKYDSEGNQVTSDDGGNFFTNMFKSKEAAPEQPQVETKNANGYTQRKLLPGNPRFVSKPEAASQPLLSSQPAVSTQVVEEVKPVDSNTEVRVITREHILEYNPSNNATVETPSAAPQESSEAPKAAKDIVVENKEAVVKDSAKKVAKQETLKAEPVKEVAKDIAPVQPAPAAKSHYLTLPSSAPVAKKEVVKEEPKEVAKEVVPFSEPALTPLSMPEAAPVQEKVAEVAKPKEVINEPAVAVLPEPPIAEVPKESAFEQVSSVKEEPVEAAVIPTVHSEVTAKEEPKETLLGRIGSKLNIFDSGKKSEPEVVYPEISSVPPKPEKFEEIKAEKDQNLDNLKLDHHVAQQEKKELDAEVKNAEAVEPTPMVTPPAAPVVPEKPEAKTEPNTESSFSALPTLPPLSAPATPEHVSAPLAADIKESHEKAALVDPTPVLEEVNVEPVASKPEENRQDAKSIEVDPGFQSAASLIDSSSDLPSPDMIRTMRPSRYEMRKQ